MRKRSGCLKSYLYNIISGPIDYLQGIRPSNTPLELVGIFSLLDFFHY